MSRRFYRSCFYVQMFAALRSHGLVSRASVLFKFLALREHKIKSLFAVLDSKPDLKERYPYLAASVTACTLPSYLHKKEKDTKINRCSKIRYCAYCWNRMTCKPYVRMTRPSNKLNIKDYVYSYSEVSVYLPLGSSREDIASAGMALFSPRWKYSRDKLASSRVLGVAELLVVHSCKQDSGSRAYKITLRKIAYCHKNSKLAKDSLKSSSRYGSAGVKFCCYPVSMLFDGPLRSIKFDEAFRRRRTMRQYGVFYGASSIK